MVIRRDVPESRSRRPADLGPPAHVSILGLVLVLSGLFAIMLPMVSSIALTLIAGTALLIAGAGQTSLGIFSPHWGGVVLHVLLGLLYLAGGLFLWANPAQGALFVAFFLAWLLLIHGIGEIGYAFRIRPAYPYLWFVASGGIALAASLWLLLRFPLGGASASGILLGVALLADGIVFLMPPRVR